MSTAVLRVKRALALAQLDAPANLERITGAANEVWYAGDYVVRISSHPGTRRLEHEANVARLLPPGVRYPGIVSYGRAEFGEWLVMRSIPGTVLARAWGGMREGERRDAVYQLAGALREVHQIKVGANNEALDRPPFLEPDSLECPHQLPLARLLRVLERARTLPNVDKGVLDQAERLARINAASLNGPPPENLVHGDLHFENVLYDKGEITALLDFEFARGASRPRPRDHPALLRGPSAARLGRLRADRQPRRLPQRAPLDPRGLSRAVREPRARVAAEPLQPLVRPARPRRRSAPQAVRPAAAVPCVPTAPSSSRRSRHAAADRVVSLSYK